MITHARWKYRRSDARCRGKIPAPPSSLEEEGRARGAASLENVYFSPTCKMTRFIVHLRSSVEGGWLARREERGKGGGLQGEKRGECCDTVKGAEIRERGGQPPAYYDSSCTAY